MGTWGALLQPGCLLIPGVPSFQVSPACDSHCGQMPKRGFSGSSGLLLEGPWLQAGGSQAGAPAPNPPGWSKGGLGTLGSGSLDFSWFSSKVVFELGNVSGFPFLSPALQFSFFQ